MSDIENNSDNPPNQEPEVEKGTENSTADPDEGRPSAFRRRIDRFRTWLIPKSVLGMVALILSFSIGASLSGVAFYAFYQYQQTQTTKKIDSYIDGFDERFRTASDTIDNETQNAQATIQQEMGPLLQFTKEGSTLAALTNDVKESVWFVESQDDAGAPSVGTAFVVQSNDNTSLLVTSFNTVKSSTTAPAPDITLVKGEERLKAKLLNWVENQDLAVVSVDRGKMRALEFVDEDSRPKVGDRTFALSGLGAAGASATQGFINDVAVGSLQQSAPVGAAYQGGPLVNSEGRIVGIASLQFAPYGFQSIGGITFAIPVQDVCKELLTCPNESSVSGARSR